MSSIQSEELNSEDQDVLDNKKESLAETLAGVQRSFMKQDVDERLSRDMKQKKQKIPSSKVPPILFAEHKKKRGSHINTQTTSKSQLQILLDFEKSEIDDESSDDIDKYKRETEERPEDNISQQEEGEESIYHRVSSKTKAMFAFDVTDPDSSYVGEPVLTQKDIIERKRIEEQEQEARGVLIRPKKLTYGDKRRSTRHFDLYDNKINSLAYYYEDLWRLSLEEYKARRLSYINDQKIKKIYETQQKPDDVDIIAPDGELPAIGKFSELIQQGDDIEDGEIIPETDEILGKKKVDKVEIMDEEKFEEELEEQEVEEYDEVIEDKIFDVEKKKEEEEEDIFVVEYQKADDLKQEVGDELKKFKSDTGTADKGKKKPAVEDKADFTLDQTARKTGKINALLAIKKEIAADLHRRQFLKLFVTYEGETEQEVTPPVLPILRRPEAFRKIRDLLKSHPFMQHATLQVADMSSAASDSIYTCERSSIRLMLGGIKISMDEILESVGNTKIFFSEDKFLPIDYLDTQPNFTLHFKPKFIKVTLECIELSIIYEQTSHWVSKEFEKKEASRVEQVNLRYDFLVSAKGRVRRRSEAESQTENILPKTRWTNTITKSFSIVTTHVSNFEMYDSVLPYYANINRRNDILMKRRLARDYLRKKKVKNAKIDFDEQVIAMFDYENFQIDSMIVRRILASNEYDEQQKRYRSSCPISKVSHKVFFGYNLKILFRYYPPFQSKLRVALSNLSFCPTNNDIIAAGYGVYSYAAMQVPKFGAVYVWHIKNPTQPERIYEFKCPVVSIAFSPYSPTLLAIGLYDGHVQVVDVKYIETEPLAISRRSTFTVHEPIVDLKWIKQSDSSNEISPFIALALNGHVIRFRIINSPSLLSYKQMILERVEGNPEGLSIKHKTVKLQANHYPQGMCLALHPEKPDIYFIMTDEGCINKCSLNYHHQYLEVYKAHDGAITCFDFSPWSPKIFLTSSNDWCIRIWIDGILKPLLTLKHTLNPVCCAYWSRTHSTIIIALNRRSFDIWDIRRTILKPVSSKVLDKSFNTVCKLSKTGRIVLIGNERGNLLCCALDNMPFEVHFQFDELHISIFKWIRHETELLREVKSVGFLGYPNKGYYDMGC